MVTWPLRMLSQYTRTGNRNGKKMRICPAAGGRRRGCPRPAKLSQIGKKKPWFREFSNVLRRRHGYRAVSAMPIAEQGVDSGFTGLKKARTELCTATDFKRPAVGPHGDSFARSVNPRAGQGNNSLLRIHARRTLRDDTTCPPS